MSKMKKTRLLKLILAVLTILLVTAIAFDQWYFSSLRLESQKLMLNANSTIKVVNSAFVDPCDYPQPLYREIVAEEAIHLAECFIIQNGYTDLPPMVDKSKLTPENVYPMTDEEGLKMRHDSLERQAYSYNITDTWGGSWEIMFRYKQHPKVTELYGDSIDNLGRAVVMNFYGKNLRLLHTDQPLKMPEAKIINRKAKEE